MVRDIDQLGAQGGREAMETIRRVSTGGPLRSLSFFHREFAFRVLIDPCEKRYTRCHQLPEMYVPPKAVYLVVYVLGTAWTSRKLLSSHLHRAIGTMMKALLCVCLADALSGMVGL